MANSKQNQMTVTDYMVGKKCVPALKAPEFHDTVPGLQQLVRIAGLCNAAEFAAPTNSETLTDRKINGDATDTAILRFAQSMASVSNMRANTKSIFRVAFNSKNKFAINVTQAHDTKALDGPILMIKGAPDILLPRCSSYMNEDASIAALDESDGHEIEVLKDHWSSQGKRVILLALKIVKSELPDPIAKPREYENNIMEQAKTELVLVGLVGIVDPPRAEIPEVVRTLRGAGIKVFMVTGDFKLTARAIAAECGIITRPPSEVDDVTCLARLSDVSNKTKESSDTLPKALVVSGAEIPLLNPDDWDAICSYDEIVFARTTPEHKLRIVKELQARDLIVGMTGDGVNDAPSLKASNVGIALGSGSDVAMEAADMILLDSFAGIVEAVRYGRVVYDNLKKTISYLLPAGSFSEFWPVITSVVFGLPQILSSFLMIIICCFTDCAAATAIAYEKPEADVLTRPPRNAKKDRLVDWKLILQAYGFIGIIETTLSFTMSYWYAQRRGVPFSTLWFGFGQTAAGLTSDEQNLILNEASSIYFVNLVVM